MEEEKKIEEMTNEEVVQELEKYADQENQPEDDGSGKGLLLLAAGGVAALVAAGVFVANKMKKKSKKAASKDENQEAEPAEGDSKVVVTADFKEVEVTETK